jgi:selenide,water dikinase
VTRDPQRLLLVGGGHSHIEVVRRLGIAPLANCAILLVSPARHASYSGMLPGLIAGHYRFEDCHIDLEQLCRKAGVAFTLDEIVALDPARARASGRHGDYPFDLLSLDVGSMPGMESVPGAAEHAVPARPVSGLLAAWRRMLAAPRPTAIIGGGAGGVELALAMHYGLEHQGTVPRISVVTDSAEVLPSHPPAARRALGRALAQRGIELHRSSRVVAVQPAAVHLDGGRQLAAEHVIWATTAAAPAWLADSGLAVDADGFVAVDETLRSTSHSRIFAAGDCAAIVDHPRPKSGVHAVRQGPVLAENLARALRGEALARHKPQRHMLALISTGGKHAVASWNGFACSGDWVWRWKDHIDRRFVATYRTEAVRD